MGTRLTSSRMTKWLLLSRLLRRARRGGPRVRGDRRPAEESLQDGPLRLLDAPRERGVALAARLHHRHAVLPQLADRRERALVQADDVERRVLPVVADRGVRSTAPRRCTWVAACSSTPSRDAAACSLIWTCDATCSASRSCFWW